MSVCHECFWWNFKFLLQMLEEVTDNDEIMMQSVQTHLKTKVNSGQNLNFAT